MAKTKKVTPVSKNSFTKCKIVGSFVEKVDGKLVNCVVFNTKSSQFVVVKKFGFGGFTKVIEVSKPMKKVDEKSLKKIISKFDDVKSDSKRVTYTFETKTEKYTFRTFGFWKFGKSGYFKA